MPSSFFGSVSHSAWILWLEDRRSIFQILSFRARHGFLIWYAGGVWSSPILKALWIALELANQSRQYFLTHHRTTSSKWSTDYPFIFLGTKLISSHAQNWLNRSFQRPCSLWLAVALCHFQAPFANPIPIEVLIISFGKLYTTLYARNWHSVGQPVGSAYQKFEGL